MLKSYNLTATRTKNISDKQQTTGTAFIIPLAICIIITLSVWVAGMDGAFVREDIMWFRILESYGPVEPTKVFEGGIQAMFPHDFPNIDWPYRPLEHLIVPSIIEIVGESFSLLILIKSLSVGISASLVYLVAMKIVRKKLVAIGAVFFFSFSIPVLIEAWWFHHMQTIVQIPILLGIYSYLQYSEKRKNKWLYVLWISAFVAPWIEEAGASLSLIVLVTILAERKFYSKLIISLPLLIVHAIFPALIPNLILQQEIVTKSIFDSFVAATITREGFFGATEIFSTKLPNEVLNFLPLLLSFVSFAAMSYYLLSLKSKFFAPALGIFFVFVISFLSIYFPNLLREHTFSSALPALLLISVGLASFRFGKLLPIWMIISVLPFFRLHYLSVNLIPVAIPWIIIVLLWLSKSFEGIQNTHPQFGGTLNKVIKRKEIIIIGLIALVILSFSDQLTNLITANETWKKFSLIKKEMGAYAKENLPSQSAIIGQPDYYESLDLAYYAEDSVSGVIVSDRSLLFPTKLVPLPQLSEFLRITPNQEIYFITQVGAGSVYGNFLNSNYQDFELVKEFETLGRFPILDPVGMIFPPPYASFKGFEFIPTTEISSDGIFREYKLKYQLYKYSPSLSPLSSHNGYDIVYYGGQYYAHPPDGSLFDIKKCRPGGYQICVYGNSMEDTKRKLDDSLQSTVLESYKDFVLVSSSDIYYAIPAVEGMFNPQFCKPGGYSLCILGESLSFVKQKLDKLLQIELVLSHKNFNILLYDGKYYAIPQGEGYFDVELVGTGVYSQSYIGESVNEIKSMIDLGDKQSFIEEYRGFDIILYKGKYYAMPKGESFDSKHCIPGEYRFCTIQFSVGKVKEKIDVDLATSLVDSYKNFNILIYNDTYYAIPQGEGYFDVELVGTSVYSASYVGSSILEIKDLIDQDS